MLFYIFLQLLLHNMYWLNRLHYFVFCNSCVFTHLILDRQKKVLCIDFFALNIVSILILFFTFVVYRNAALHRWFHFFTIFVINISITLIIEIGRLCDCNVAIVVVVIIIAMVFVIVLVVYSTIYSFHLVHIDRGV